LKSKAKEPRAVKAAGKMRARREGRDDMIECNDVGVGMVIVRWGRIKVG
jgi:hypothetical protein